MIINKIKKIRQAIKRMFKINGMEEEIAIIVLGVGGVVALLLNVREVAMFCFGAVAGYLSKGFKEARKERE